MRPEAVDCGMLRDRKSSVHCPTQANHLQPLTLKVSPKGEEEPGCMVRLRMSLAGLSSCIELLGTRCMYPGNMSETWGCQKVVEQIGPHLSLTSKLLIGAGPPKLQVSEAGLLRNLPDFTGWQ